MTDALLPFEASKLKVERARRHIESFVQESAIYGAYLPLMVMCKQPPEWVAEGRYAWVVSVQSPIPKILSVVMGDAIHNLRTALDLLACDLVRLNNRGVSGVYFPFGVDEAEFEKCFVEKNLTRTSSAVQKVLRALKPWRGGNDALRALHELDIQDKHKTLIPVIGQVYIPSFSITNGTEVKSFAERIVFVEHDGQQLVVFPASLEMRWGTVSAARIALSFPRGSPFAESVIVPTLHELANLVAGIIDSFATLCAGQSFPSTTGGAGSSVRADTLVIDDF